MTNTTTGHLQFKEPINLSEISSEALAEAVAMRMQERTGESGLENFCRYGGSVAEAEVALTLDPFDNESKTITGEFEVWFQESYYSGCKDIDWRESYRGKGTVVIDVASGAVEIETEAWHIPDARDMPDDDNEAGADI